jgi:hypothetical protein
MANFWGIFILIEVLFTSYLILTVLNIYISYQFLCNKPVRLQQPRTTAMYCSSQLCCLTEWLLVWGAHSGTCVQLGGQQSWVGLSPHGLPSPGGSHGGHVSRWWYPVLMLNSTAWFTFPELQLAKSHIASPVEGATWDPTHHYVLQPLWNSRLQFPSVVLVRLSSVLTLEECYFTPYSPFTYSYLVQNLTLVLPCC